MLTQEYIKSILNYNKETGCFTWNESLGKRIHAGEKAGYLNSNGYWRITIKKNVYPAHRIAWMYIYGSWPKHDIDHINRDRSDNRISNLREANRAENCQNKSIACNNTSGHQGIVWHKAKMRWQAQITINGKQIYLGRFKTIDEALTARINAKSIMHTFHPSQI